MNLTELVKESNYIICFSGAGISVESGIPDFRSSSGLYMSGEFEGYNPETLLTLRMLRKDPRLVLKFYNKRLRELADKEPNRSHIAFKKLEDMGKLKCVITQNIDNLHRKAGNTKVYELHGNGRRFKCNIKCGKEYTYEEFSERLKTEEVPKCDCEFSFIRPDVVMFDEYLDDDVYDAAYDEIPKADLIIVVGSSLIVQPAANLLLGKRKGSKLVIINNSETPFDKYAALTIRENCGDVLTEVIEKLVMDSVNPPSFGEAIEHKFPGIKQYRL